MAWQMTLTYTLLAILAGVASLLCLWAWRTGDPGEDINKIVVRPAARHSQAVRQEVTQRLRPAAPGKVTRGLPRREDLPWNQ
jgi:hypothetical protein